MIADWLAAYGVTFVDHQIPGYGTPDNPTPGGHTNLEFVPEGLLIHHTGSPHTAIETVTEGRRGVPGPLYQVYVDRTPMVHLITEGRANHAGQGDAAVLLEVRAEVPPSDSLPGADDISGNRYFYSVALQGPDHTEAQVELAAVCADAVLNGMGWSENRMRGHKEWTGRKVDPSAFSMDWFRGQVDVMAHMSVEAQAHWQEAFERSQVAKHPTDGVSAARPSTWTNLVENDRFLNRQLGVDPADEKGLASALQSILDRLDALEA